MQTFSLQLSIVLASVFNANTVFFDAFVHTRMYVCIRMFSMTIFIMYMLSPLVIFGFVASDHDY